MKIKQLFYKCKNCGDVISANTNSQLVYCQCGKLGVDGNEFYVRVIGDKKDFELVNKSNIYAGISG
ncbi:MAG: hypothetical protein WC745_02735 [Patescibacteria group bacterium]